ncbi:four helix bundle protein [Gelidibacter mesophilus]|uniref:four helix bundle protein n=1 Tax=Gelidibacter mesophilus TaxID=169050 RepID=UPI00040EBD8E|nr:four helix bundle protein [Gelidibacter mesophilus]
MKEIIKNRTKKFASDCWHLCAEYPISREYNAYSNQLIRCSSSVGPNYRAACRAKSDADERMYFIELLLDVSDKVVIELKRFHGEANEILSIIGASLITIRNRNRKS